MHACKSAYVRVCVHVRACLFVLSFVPLFARLCVRVCVPACVRECPCVFALE